MKFIGQYIQSLKARFRSSVYLENLTDPGSDTDKFLVADSDGKVGYRSGNNVLSDLGIASDEILDWTADQSAANTIHTNNITDLHGAGVDGAVNQVLTDNGDGTVTSEAGLKWDGNILLVSSSTSARPMLSLNSDNTDAEAPELHLYKNSASADGDDLGKIRFSGFDDAANDEHDFAQILGEVVDASDGAEEGKLSLFVASHDAELQPGLIIQSGDAEDKVDVTIGNTATSLTTIAGNLTVTGTLTSDAMGSGNSYAAGLVPAGSSIHETKFLRKDGTFAVPYVYLGMDGISMSLNLISVDLKANGGLVIESGKIALDLGASSITNNLTIPVDLTSDGAGTIHANNVPTLNQSTTGNAATATTLTAGDKSLSSIFTLKGIVIDDDRNLVVSADGQALHIDSMAMTDATTSASGTHANYHHVMFEQPILLASNASVTTTTASTVYIKGAPAAGTNQTITNAYAFYVGGGDSYFEGGSYFASQSTFAGNIVVGGPSNASNSWISIYCNDTGGTDDDDSSGGITFYETGTYSINAPRYGAKIVYNEDADEFAIGTINDNTFNRQIYMKRGLDYVYLADQVYIEGATPGLQFQSTDTSIVATNSLGDLNWKSADDSNVTLQIKGIATETHATNSAGGSKLEFYVTPNTTSTVAIAATIDQNKDLLIEGDLQVKGNDIKDDDGTTCITFNSDSSTTIPRLRAPIRELAPTSTSTSGDANGDVVFFGQGPSGGDTVAGLIYCYKSTGYWELSDADSADYASGLLAVAIDADPSTDGMLIRGMVTHHVEIEGTEAKGSIVYLSATDGGVATVDPPTGSGDIIRVLGYALDTDNDQLYFNPSMDWIEIA